MLTGVAPLAGAWIETAYLDQVFDNRARVAPLAGAWIETSIGLFSIPTFFVAPLAGAWIETVAGAKSICCDWSHPSRVRGLKLACTTVETPGGD